MPVPSNVRSLHYKGWAKICIYNIVYVYRTAVDGLSGLMFGFTSWTLLPCIVGVDVPEPSMPVPVCKSSNIWGLGGTRIF